MKACILAAGRGKRLNPLTETKPKPIIPVGGKALLQHTIEMLEENGVKEILLIVGYKKEMIKEKFKDGKDFGVALTYKEQKEFLGTGHATNIAKDFVGDDSFLLIYGDLLMDEHVFKRAIKAYNENKYQGVITAMPVKDPTKFGILSTNSEGNLVKLVEKPPDDRYGNLANAGVYIFSPNIFKAIEKTEKSPRGEYELTDAIEISLEERDIFHVVDIEDLFWSDVGHPWQLLDANKHFIESLQKGDKQISEYAIIEKPTTLKGIIKIGEGTTIKSGTYIEGPVIIGKNCEIGPNAYIRPFSVIGNGCKIGNSSEVKNTIVMQNSAIPHLSYAGDSIIGENVNLGCGTVFANVRLDNENISMKIKGKRVDTHHRKIGAIVGDNVSFGINVCVMPGKKIGHNSQIGSNTVVSKDINANTLYYATQDTSQKTIKAMKK